MTRVDYATVEDAVAEAVLVAWDGCHKCYVAMDAEQAEWYAREYPVTVEDTPDRMLAVLREWWEASCGLRFVQATRTDSTEPEGTGFVRLIGQGDEWEEPDWRDAEPEEDWR